MKGSSSRVSHPPSVYSSLACVELKVDLYQMFSAYGEVIDVRMSNVQKMRGQAFVVFREQEMCDRALQALRGFSLMGKALVTNLKPLLTRWENRTCSTPGLLVIPP